MLDAIDLKGIFSKSGERMNNFQITHVYQRDGNSNTLASSLSYFRPSQIAASAQSEREIGKKGQVDDVRGPAREKKVEEKFDTHV